MEIADQNLPSQKIEQIFFTSPGIGKIAAALAKAQAELPIIKKNKKVELNNTSYTYADLSVFLEASLPILAKNDIAVLNPSVTGSEGVGVSTVLVHSSGEWFRSGVVWMKPSDKKPQSIGSILSYARRYSFVSFVSMATGQDDNDAIAENSGEIVPFTGTKKQMEIVSSLFNIHKLHKSDRQKLTDWLIVGKHPSDKDSLSTTIAAAAAKIGGSNK